MKDLYDESTVGRKYGRIKNFFMDKGFGFIHCFDDGKNYFCQISQFVDDVPVVGYTVEFSVYHNDKNDKDYCSNVLVVEEPERRRK